MTHDDADMDLILRMVGPELYYRMVSLFAGSRVYFPKRVLYRKRNAEISRSPESIDSLVRKYGITRQRINQIRSLQLDFHF